MHLSPLVVAWLREVVGAAGIDPVVRGSERADAQANEALAVAKELGRSPRPVAVEICAEAGGGVGVSFEVASPGFINITFSDSFLGDQLVLMAEDPRLGVQLSAVVIDYSAPNVAKEMDAGHLRTTLIGDALASLSRV